jgi:hypothetical protein
MAQRDEGFDSPPAPSGRNINMIYECTDCKHCADFHDGFRVICLHPQLDPGEVEKYHPVGDGDAEECDGFEEEYIYAHQFTWDNFSEAETYSNEKYHDVTYEGIREWCEIKLKKG